jgi:protein subunit release factor A
MIWIDVFVPVVPVDKCQHNGSAVRITHTLGCCRCQDERSQLKNKQRALSILKSKLYDLQKESLEGNVDMRRKDSIKGGDRSVKIRTYNFPQSRVTDHRIKKSWYNLEAILNGDLFEISKSMQWLSKKYHPLACGIRLVWIECSEISL